MTIPSGSTRILTEGRHTRLFRRRFSLQVVEGPDRGASLTSAKECVSVGTAPQNDLVLSDATVSRHHLRVEVLAHGFLLSDLESTNGTRTDTLGVRQVVVDAPLELKLGETLLRFAPLAEEEEVPLVEADRFGAVLGRSPAMREVFRQLEAISPTDVTVLLEGETGTGKELIAEAIHQHSPRHGGPFVIVDCGAIPPTLIESELFGYARGAFTGASNDRPGAFEAAAGGTVFLDEIGELDLQSQPRLLRVLEQRQVKRLGEAQHRRVDVRVIAATNRDLQRSVNHRTFRADLYYRLAVCRVRVPPLRQRPEDVEFLIQHMLPEIGARLQIATPSRLDAETLRQATSHPWPGNVRELRNFLERLLTLSASSVPLEALEKIEPASPGARVELDDLIEHPFREAKAMWLAHFDLEYLRRLLERCEGNVAEASRRSGIARVHLFRLIKKYGLRG